ncbi:DNA gyrase/topoisomerase IV subunit A [Microbacter margulisiae]|uniref:Topoisomerase-4 subunit A n=1 Tax=Microbacter margulisiae TaxID=1350067 RepID=A0A7W5DP42_9PORP|nr:DNA gyrase/topoisomerase IV subunit A [Microbacter margulisiae]MBB3186431.1 topoisomerase-4 subunit A [Microbacter margulisiae]
MDDNNDTFSDDLTEEVLDNSSDNNIDGQSIIESSKAHSDYHIPNPHDDQIKHHLSGMYQNWFLDYASYVILERAVPHIYDGLKPVQRRILHSMKRMDDGRYNKVANIVGHTMQFHPHGDASIGDALVQLGQKDLLVDCQGNWGNILTGDGAAAPRYIEAKLSKFALEVLFNPKTTVWKLSYDGRNKEPVALPAKFPLLLAQGVEGIAVGLNVKILPHNFNELLDASIAYLKNEPFILYPDFQTGGYVDVSKYNDGERGGTVKVRAKINKIDNKTLVINDIPFGANTSKLIESILKANEKGKIKIRKVDDNTAQKAEIVIYLQPGVSSDKTIDALYAFTECERSISPNCCVIKDNKPYFINVTHLLQQSVVHTKSLLKLELEIERSELLEALHFASLEMIFIHERIYKDKPFEESATIDDAINHVRARLAPFTANFVREVTNEDIIRLFEIKTKRFLKFSVEKAEDEITSIREQLKQIDFHLAHLVEYTIDWYQKLKDKYGARYPRCTEIRNFETIEAAKVVEANEKLYVNYEEGFIGTGLKKDTFLCNCSDIDDVIILFKDGKYKVVKVAEKLFVGKNILYISLFKKNDKRTIYNLVYRNGRNGAYYMKRFAVTGVTRDKEYDVTQGKENSKILYFSANPNGEAEVIRIALKPKPRIKNLVLEKDFSTIAIKGRQSMGNLLTKNDILKISLKHKGASTLGGRDVWFDHDVLRLNYDGRGDYLGEFQSEDLILVIHKNGEYYTSNFDLTNHYEPDILVIEQFDKDKVWSAILFDAEQGYPYLKRFMFESTSKPVNFLGDHSDSYLIHLSGEEFPQFELSFGGDDIDKEPVVIDVEEFVGVKSCKAKGKRLTTWQLLSVKELEPKAVADDQDENPSSDEEGFEILEEPKVPDASREVEKNLPDTDFNIDEITGQTTLF